MDDPRPHFYAVGAQLALAVATLIMTLVCLFGVVLFFLNVASLEARHEEDVRDLLNSRADELNKLSTRIDLIEVRSTNNKQRILILEAENERSGLQRGRMPATGFSGRTAEGQGATAGDWEPDDSPGDPGG